MKRIFKLTYMALVAVMAMAISSCTNDYDYDAATAEGEQVYFSDELGSTVELSATESAVNVPIKRVNTAGELTVKLDVSIPEGANYSIPTQVTFADGAAEANIPVSYDPSNIEYGKYDEITIAVADAEYTTPYGASSYTFNAGLTEWKTISNNGGVGSFRDGIMSYLYGKDLMTYNVEIQESAITPGKYRVVSPYGPGTDFYEAYVDGSTFKWDATLNSSIVIDATDPDYVYITGGSFYAGTSDEDGFVLSLLSYVDLYLANGYSISTIKEGAPSIFGKLKDGVITFPANAVLYLYEGSYYGGSTDQLAIALPGYALTDYSSSYSYTGRFTDTANQEYAIGTITLGEDVATAKYVVAAASDDIEAIVSGINDGTIESTEISEGGEVRVQLTESGKYVMVIVTYDADGTMRSYSTSDFTFRLSSATEDWQAVYSGTFTYNWKPAFIQYDSGEYAGSIYEGTEDVVLYADANNEGTYKIAPWANSADGLIFTMDNEGVISFQDIDTGETYESYGSVFAGDPYTLGVVSSATSFYQDGTFYFGTVYYVSEGYIGGAYETFTPTASASSAPAKLKALTAKAKIKTNTAKVKATAAKAKTHIKAKSMKMVKPMRKKIDAPKKLN